MCLVRSPAVMNEYVWYFMRTDVLIGLLFIVLMFSLGLRKSVCVYVCVQRVRRIKVTHDYMLFNDGN